METSRGSKIGPPTIGERYAFDNFEIDAANRMLLRDGIEVPLTRKVFDLLLVFAANPGRLLDKDELIEKIWQSDFVEEGNLARNVSSLRKALRDTGTKHRYISTVQGHGYRFVADVTHVNGIQTAAALPPEQFSQTGKDLESTGGKHFSRRSLLIISLAVFLLAGAAWLGGERVFTPANKIRSLAVLPLKSLDSGDNYLGIGIADAVIRRISQTGQMTVRPTSAVLRYADTDSEPLAVARELSTDAVLEGNIQRSGDRMRVSVNLLRTGDGTSVWADSFDMPAADIFAIQDKVAQLVVTRLQLHHDLQQQTGVTGKYPTSPAAYELYIKGIVSLDQRGYGDEAMPQMQETIDLLKRSIEADPTYALAHAQLAWAYVWTAEFIKSKEPNWADLARQEIKRADDLDSQIAETHLAKAMLFWSKYENYQNDAALRELLIAKRLNPNTSHGELVGILGHLGLDEQAMAELQHALEVDPTSKSLKDLKVILPFLRGDTDAQLNELKTPPNGRAYFGPLLYMRKGQLDIAKKSIDERFPEGQKYPDFMVLVALYSALKGDLHQAESNLPELMAMIPVDQNRHHVTYDVACIYALDGKSSEAMKWLRETAATGFPNYPLFARDPFLDRIRQSPEFLQFMADEKAQWEKFRQEYGEESGG